MSDAYAFYAVTYFNLYRHSHSRMLLFKQSRRKTRLVDGLVAKSGVCEGSTE